MRAESYFILYVADQARSRAFYSATLALRPRLDVPGMTEFDLPAGGVLGLMPESSLARLLGMPARSPAPGRDVPGAELYLLDRDAVALHARALLAGARELSPMRLRDWGHVAAYSQDPDGHILAFAYVHDAGDGTA